MSNELNNLPSTFMPPSATTLTHLNLYTGSPSNPELLELARSLHGMNPELARSLREIKPLVPAGNFDINHWVGSPIDPTLRPAANPKLLAEYRRIYERDQQCVHPQMIEFMEKQKTAQVHPHMCGTPFDPKLNIPSNPTILAAARKIYETSAMSKNKEAMKAFLDLKEKQEEEEVFPQVQTSPPPTVSKQMVYISPDDLSIKIENCMHQLMDCATADEFLRVTDLYVIFMRFGTMLEQFDDWKPFELKSMNLALGPIFSAFKENKIAQITASQIDLLNAVLHQLE